MPRRLGLRTANLLFLFLVASSVSARAQGRIFDAEASDIDYFYTSRLPGERDAGIDDIHTHPALPRSA